MTNVNLSVRAAPRLCFTAVLQHLSPNASLLSESLLSSSDLALHRALGHWQSEHVCWNLTLLQVAYEQILVIATCSHCLSWLLLSC